MAGYREWGIIIGYTVRKLVEMACWGVIQKFEVVVWAEGAVFVVKQKVTECIRSRFQVEFWSCKYGQAFPTGGETVTGFQNKFIGNWTLLQITSGGLDLLVGQGE